MINSLVQDYFMATYKSDSMEEILTTSNESEENLQVFSLLDKQISKSKEQEVNT